MTEVLQRKWETKDSITLVRHNALLLQLKPGGDPRATDGSGGDREGPDLSNWIDAGTGESADICRPDCTRAYNQAFDAARERTVRAMDNTEN